MHLVIVESPTKAKTIGRFLGKEYEVKASMGHVMDLPKSTLGVDVEKHFAPLYEMMPDKKKTISELKSLAKHATDIILATDPDREGEAIASHVKDMLVDKKGGKKFFRIVFHEITKEAIEEALKSPRDIDARLVDSQTARRVLDRLVGYKLSPLLWRKVRKGLSAGRVQSIALRLIVEREKEREKFKKETYFTVIAKLSKKTGDTTIVPFELVEIKGEKIEEQEAHTLYDGEYTVTKTALVQELQTQKIVQELQKATLVVSDVSEKQTKRSPQPPYTTSTLQQDASRRFGFSGKRTMRAAQRLYEEGYITYHRTDSVAISNAAVSAIRSFVSRELGDKYLPEKSRFYVTKQKLAQEAHEAIRPTRFDQITNLKTQNTADTGSDGWRTYELIWRRAVASQMSDALIDSTAVIVDSEQKSTSSNNWYRLKANGSVLVFDGFLKINPQALQDNRLPIFTISETLDLHTISSEPHETQPPPRYNDASLIKTLEEKGIGRPSTYAPIISTIEDRQYIERDPSASSGRGARFIPTPVGTAVSDFLVANFSDIDDIPFTAQMEDELDGIAHEGKDWVSMIENFYTPFAKKLESVGDVARVKIAVEETDQKCEKCGAPLVIRTGRFGKFLSCSRFPDCDFKKSLVEETNFTCPKDGGKIIIKKTRKGRRFYGCSNYPKCNFAAWKLEDIIKN